LQSDLENGFDKQYRNYEAELGNRAPQNCGFQTVRPNNAALE
jgi:hypothetical protein